MRTNTIILTLIFLLMFISIACAQVNIEKLRKNEDIEGFSGNIEIDISSRTGNVEFTEINYESRSNYIWKEMNTFLILRGDYGWESGEQYSNEALAHLRHVFRLGENLQPEIFAQIDYNEEILLSFRGLVGSGLRCAMHKGQNAKLWLGTAFMFEHESLDLEKIDIHKKEVNIARWSNYLTASNDLNESIRWVLTNYYQPAFENFNDYRILSETSLIVKLFQNLSLDIGFRLRYDSQPPQEIKSFDTALKTGLVFNY